MQLLKNLVTYETYDKSSKQFLLWSYVGTQIHAKYMKYSEW